ncbi:MAG: patatin-like phospholipase family protein [Pseudomonadota bacterium]
MTVNVSNGGSGRSLARSVLAFLLPLLLALPPLAGAEENGRPRIGLVLGGGGAAGVAHVGVIQALEARGIRPDVVAGTSMGAIVGGLYASGLDPVELERAVTAIDWSTILNDQSDRQLLHPMRRDSRIDPLSVQTELPVGIGEGGVQVDAGLVDAVKLTLELRRLAARAEGVSDFDDLAIPFRAVATDLVSGEAVVLGEGDLATALRASMSIPALFPPVEIGERLLVDGGVVNNLPVNVARAMGADIVIVSEIPGAEVTRDDLRSLTAALAQTLSIVIAANSREQTSGLGPADIHLVPDVGAVGMLAFEEAPTTVAAGQAAVAAETVQLAALAYGRSPIPPSVEAQDPLTVEIAYDRIEIDHSGTLDRRVIRARLDLPEQGPVSIGEIEIALRRVYGLGTLDTVQYRVEQQRDQRVLVVKAEPVSSGSLQPRLGLGLSNVFGGDGDFTLVFGLSANDLNSLGGRLEFDATIGDTDGARLRFEQPLDFAQTFFLRPGASYFRRTGTLFLGPDRPVSEVRVSQTSAGFDALWAPGNWGRVGFGVSYLHTVSTVRNGLLSLSDVGRELDDEMPLSFLLDYDTLDDPDLPTAGIQFATAVDFDLLDGASASRVEVDAVAAQSFGHHTLSPFMFLQGDIDSDNVISNFIGGFQRLSGFEEGELIGSVVGVAGLRYYYRFPFDSLFGKEAFLGGGGEYGGAYASWGDLGQEGSFVAGSLFAGIETSLGPLILGFGMAETGQYAGTLTLGTRF